MASVAEIILKYKNQFSDQAKRDLLAFEKQHKSTMATAKDSADILKDTLGIQLPRELTKLIASSKLIGPALAASFNVIAIIGFIGVLKQVPELFDEMAAAVTGWDEKAKESYESVIEQNKKLIEILEKARIAQMKLSGATDAATVGQKIKFVETELKRQQELAASLAQQIEFQKRLKETQASLAGLPSFVGKFLPDTGAESIKELTTQMEAAQQVANKLDIELRELKAIDLPEAFDKDAKAAEKVADALAKLNQQSFLLNLRMRELREESQGKMLQNVTGPGGPLDPATFAKIKDEIGSIPTSFFSDEQLGVITKKAQEASDSWKETMLRANETIADSQLRASEAFFRKQQETIRSIRDSAGAVWDDFFMRGQSVLQSLSNMAKGLFNTVARTAFQNVTQTVLTGSSGTGGLLGTLSKVPGLSKVTGVLGLGGAAAPAFAAGAGGSIIAGSSTIIGGAVVPTIPAIGIGGAGAATGSSAAGLGLFGLSGAATLGIGAAVAGAVFLGMKLFRRHTQEAPFYSDPMAGERNRTMFFFTSMQDSFETFSKAVDKFTGKVDSVPPGYVVRVGMNDAIQNSNEFRRTIGGGFLEETL